MNATSDRFQVVTFHGEGATVYYAVDAAAPEAEQPAIVRSWSTRDDRKGASALWLAQDFCRRHNASPLPPSPAAGGAK